MKPEHEQYILKNIGRKPAEAIAKDLGLKERKIKRFLEKQKEKQMDPEKRGVLSANGETSPNLIKFGGRYAPSSIGKRKIFLSILLIIILGFAVYGNTLNGEFVWDDEYIIENNIYLTDWSYIPKIFTENIIAGSGRKSLFYRPVQMLTYVLDYSLWKLNVQGYHLTNIVLHVLAALSVYFLLNVIFGNNRLSLLTGILFIIHPIHTEVVAYISGRADSLALLFMMLCFLFYIKRFGSKNINTYILMVLSYMAALLSRENSLILPAIILVYHYSFKKKIAVNEFCSIVGLAFIYILLRMTVFKTLLVDDTPSITTLSQRLPGFFAAISQYVRLLFLPFDLHMEYGHQLFHWGDIKAILGVAICVSSVVFVLKRREKDKIVFFSIAWFFISLLPVSNLYPINAYMSEHWLYLPSVGFFLIAAKSIDSLCGIKNLKMVIIIFASGLVIFYSYLTVRQNVYWGEKMVLYEWTLKCAPDSSRAHNNLGSVYVAENREKEAITLYKKAVEINPENVEAYNNLGVVYASANRAEEAIELYKKAIDINPSYADAHYNFGVVYAITNETEKAITAYKEAIKIHPGYIEAYFHLGVACDVMNRKEEAVVLFQKAIELNPDYVDAHNNLGVLYGKMGRKQEALSAYKKAIEINPDFVQAYLNLSVAYLHDRQYKLAIEYCDKAKELGFVDSGLVELLNSYRE